MDDHRKELMGNGNEKDTVGYQEEKTAAEKGILPVFSSSDRAAASDCTGCPAYDAEQTVQKAGH